AGQRSELDRRHRRARRRAPGLVGRRRGDRDPDRQAAALRGQGGITYRKSTGNPIIASTTRSSLLSASAKVSEPIVLNEIEARAISLAPSSSNSAPGPRVLK